MTQVVTSNDERIKCLQNVLKINPNNETAKRGLTTFQQQAANQSQQAEPTKIETQEKPIELPSLPAHIEQQLPVEDSSLPRKLKPIEPQATKECPYCAEIIKANATVCRFCGRQLETGQNVEPSQKVAVQKAPSKPKKQNLLVIGLVALGLLCVSCMFLGVLGRILSPVKPTVTTAKLELPTAKPEVAQNQDSIDNAPLPSNTPVLPNQPPPAEEISSAKTLNFSEIVRNPEDAGWTDVQFDEYKKTLKGLRAEGWQGDVVEVKQAIGGDYYIEIDMPGTEDTVDVFLYIQKDIALSLGKGQQLTFSGTIDGLYPNLFGNWSVEVKDATISNVAGASAGTEAPAQPLPAGGVLNFNEIVRNPEDVGWTDVQFDEYKKSIKGSRAENWQGSVVDVKQSIGGDYYVDVDIPSTEDRVDVFLYINKDKALSLSKGQQIVFSGIIDGLYPEVFEDWKVEVKDAVIK